MKPRIALVAALLAGLAPAAAMPQVPADFERQHGRRVAFDHDDPRISDFARLVAVAMKVPYFVESTPKGQKVWLAPRSNAEETEIQHRISQFAFVVKTCGRPGLVTPHTPAGTVKSCPP